MRSAPLPACARGTHLTARRSRRWPALGLVLAAGLAVASILWPDWRDDHLLRDAEADADRLDPGWRLEELLSRRDAPSPGRNSALVVQAAKRQLPTGWPHPQH